MQKQLIMKLLKRIVILSLLTAVFLTGCNDSGFSIARHDGDEEQQTRGNANDDAEDNKEGASHSGSNGGGDDSQNNPVIDDPVINDPGEEENTTSTPTIDLTGIITTFSFTSVETRDTNYVVISFDKDPFDDKYDFSYYTVNDERLDKNEYRHLDNDDNKAMYELYVGQLTSGTYVLKFYNSSNKPYGRANISISIKSNVTNNSYVSVAFDLVRIRFISFSFGIQRAFKKIGDFFSNLFNGNRISL